MTLMVHEVELTVQEVELTMQEVGREKPSQGWTVTGVRTAHTPGDELSQSPLSDLWLCS